MKQVYKVKNKVPLMYFSNDKTLETLEAWTGGTHYKHLFHIELFGYKLEFWKKS